LSVARFSAPANPQIRFPAEGLARFDALLLLLSRP
jgi:hypothetical protein